MAYGQFPSGPPLVIRLPFCDGQLAIGNWQLANPSPDCQPSDPGV
jgi:hypothetical protein